MNIVINPDYSKLSLFIKQLPSDFSNGGDMIYEARNQIKKFRVQDNAIKFRFVSTVLSMLFFALVKRRELMIMLCFF